MIAISLSKLLYKCLIGSGGDTSGRAMPFCLSRPGSNPLNDGFSFFCSELMSIYSYLALGFFYKCVIEQCILFLLLSCFQSSFTIAKFINCYITILEKGKRNPKRGLEMPRLKKILDRAYPNTGP